MPALRRLFIAALLARLRQAEAIHAVVRQHQPHMPGGSDEYRSMAFSDTSAAGSGASEPPQHTPAEDPRVRILLEKLVALRREVPRVPTAVEWDQCLRGIVKCT